MKEEQAWEIIAWETFLSVGKKRRVSEAKLFYYWNMFPDRNKREILKSSVDRTQEIIKGCVNCVPVPVEIK